MDDQLLIKHLLGETDTRESESVAKWLAEDTRHQKRYAQMKWLWEKAALRARSSEVDVEQAWGRFHSLRDKSASHSAKGLQKWLSKGWGKMVAAGLVLALVVGALAFYLPHSGRALFSEVLLESGEMPRIEVLLDGSVITLNKHSRLTYSQKWGSSNRLVHLSEGEVYFEVKKNSEKPFVIYLQETSIRVVGTSFHVRAAGNEASLVVDSGKVAVKFSENEQLVTSGEKVTIDRLTGTLQKEKSNDELFRYYHSNKFVAKNTPLPELVKALNEAYESQIEITSERAGKLAITTTLEYGSLKQNLEVIRQTLDVQINTSGNKIRIE